MPTALPVKQHINVGDLWRLFQAQDKLLKQHGDALLSTLRLTDSLYAAVIAICERDRSLRPHADALKKLRGDGLQLK